MNSSLVKGSFEVGDLLQCIFLFVNPACFIARYTVDKLGMCGSDSWRRIVDAVVQGLSTNKADITLFSSDETETVERLCLRLNSRGPILLTQSKIVDLGIDVFSDALRKLPSVK